ncbi:Lrp/AsnC family transcriptional regulator [Streptomyces sp. NBC_00005]|uniref:Lrp/AsnC family transcriptional regulator n=1 Tax=Streptomyces sp. NBC_00005 TaxID=2903609 RepID=UPI0032562D32
MVDTLDRQIIHALQHSPRASFRRIGAVVGVSEQTVARRYQALRRDGVVRVLGRIAPAAHGHSEWVARISCRPDRVNTLAHALIGRPDIYFAHITSGGAEIICIVHSPADGPHDDVLLQQLPKAVSVLNVHIDLLLHGFGPGRTSNWVGYDDRLTPEQEQQLTADRIEPVGETVEFTSEDAALLAVLTEDGRAGHTQLAAATGWSKGRVARRLEALEAAGTLFYDVDLLPDRLGYHMHATVWLRVAPHHLEGVGEELARHEETAFVGAVSGPHNIMAVVICRNSEELYGYLTTRVATIQAIDGYEVSIRVRRLKQAGSVVTRGRLVPPSAHR